jgi:hypothetical protein
MFYWDYLSAFARRDLQILWTLYWWYWICIFFSSLFAGALAHWLMRSSLRSFDWATCGRCWFASLVGFLGMVVVALASHWWEAKQTYHRVDWFAAAVVTGFFAPFVAEIWHLRASDTSLPRESNRKRWIISLRSVVILQLIVLVAGGLWIGALREEIAAKESARRAAERQRAFELECADRFAKLGLSARLVFKGAESHIHLAGGGKGLAELQQDDVITFFQADSRYLTKADLQAIYKVRTLLRLKLGDCFLDADSANIRQLDDLRMLELRNTPIAAETIAAISQLPKLEDVKIDSSLATDDDFAILCKSTSLKFLVIKSSSITDRGLEAVAENRSLRRLVIRNSQVSPTAAEQLRTKRPELKLSVVSGP